MPVADIERLLEERPEAINLAASGMPVGSPGMEMGTYRETHDVILVKLDDTSEVWSHYPEKQWTQFGKAIAQINTGYHCGAD